MTTVCKNCKLYKGDCGHHFVDGNAHIDYDIPDEKARNFYGQCVYYEDKDFTIEDALNIIDASNIDKEKADIIKGLILRHNTPDMNVDIYAPFVKVTARLKFSIATPLVYGFIRGLQDAYLHKTNIAVNGDIIECSGYATEHNVKSFMKKANEYCSDIEFI